MTKKKLPFEKKHHFHIAGSQLWRKEHDKGVIPLPSARLKILPARYGPEICLDASPFLSVSIDCFTLGINEGHFYILYKGDKTKLVFGEWADFIRKRWQAKIDYPGQCLMFYTNPELVLSFDSPVNWVLTLKYFDTQTYPAYYVFAISASH